MIYTPLCYDRECASFDICVTWYINCYHLKEANKSDYNNESRIWGWPLYQLLRDDDDNEEIHDFTCTVIDDSSAETPPVIQIPSAYSSMMPLQKVATVILTPPPPQNDHQGRWCNKKTVYTPWSTMMMLLQSMTP